ncbi:MAG: HAD hydrolase-like protein, partial [Candidatus Aenigmarchaeota archaeon]|nr:HAD hydrolase-like protein [Candidatus Aenigmarchaeota archaeon]NIS73033.1 HAD hydrolase-like protein [Candidatus Aenigmarchaeota archaeon]
MFKLVIFDLDGTLIDSAGAILKSVNITFSELGLGPYKWEKDIVRFFGRPFEEWAETLLKEAGKYSKENLERMANRMWDNYATIGVKHAKLYPGAL